MLVQLDDPDHDGWRNYKLEINKDLICSFRHKRSHGLATCLRKAAEAVDDNKMENWNKGVNN